MQYSQWHTSVVKKVGPVSELTMYLRSAVFSVLVFGLFYGYLSFQGVSNTLNKTVADTSIVLIGLSMLLSSLCYFWDAFDSKIVYRKHLGLVGFAYALAHTWLSSTALKRLFQVETWERGAMYPMLTGFVALVIFAIMAVISNKYMATELGGKVWRSILRTGYVGVVFVWMHVLILKSPHWVTWIEDGMKTPPALSLLVSVFMAFVVIMRVALWISLRAKNTT